MVWRPVDVCGVGSPGHLCGRPAVTVIAVQPYPSILVAARSEPGVVYLCAYHRDTPVKAWDDEDDG